MFFIIKGHGFVNEIQTITQVFYPNEKFIRAERISETGITAVSEVLPGSGGSDSPICRSEIFRGGVSLSEYETAADGAAAYCVKRCMFLCLCAAEGYSPDWGVLTGIRPSKLAHSMRAEGLSDGEIIKRFSDEFFVKRGKAELCLRVADVEEKVIAASRGGYSVYVGIPFCPSRCLYCSFTSQPIGKCQSLADGYIGALERELSEAGENIKASIGGTGANRAAPDAVYIGGGTPTSLSLSQLDRLLAVVSRVFPAKTEFTVEAGRPDTIDRAKLRLMKGYGVTRLSINPQTMNGNTLALIGRRHTGGQFLEAFALARDEGHRNINVDLILGLPGETSADVRETLRRVLALSPESLTAHVLAVKRASRLKEELASHSLTREGVEDMLEAAALASRGAGMRPYYMYRQKNMLGSFENVGYAKPGFDCVYNVMIMTERQSVLAFGAGAVTKTVDPRTGLIERVFNVKSAEEYIGRVGEMIERKKGVVLWVR